MPDGHTHLHVHDSLTEEERLARLQLIRSRRVGAVTWHRLMAEHGSAVVALQALPDIARASGVENYAVCPEEVVLHEMTQGRLAGAVLLCHGAPDYPAALADVADAPPVLWALGDISLLQQPCIAMVGARNASSLGLRMAKRLSETLGEAGQVVISGLARGIDTEAHRAALATGTIAVMAGGVDVIYPEENTSLAAEIAARGCRLSDQPLGLVPQARHFPLRNRVIAALSRAVVVVEAAARSGSLITARDAADLGREVLAVPGHPFDARAAGCNMLIRDGATLVRGAADVLEAIGAQRPRVTADAVDTRPPLPGPVPARRPLPEIAALHGQILSRLGPSPLAEDQLIRDLALPAHAVASELVTLELEGKIIRAAGGLLSRTG
ncbi:MAG: DNA-processing protein DprA [Pseudomonadota bacterium]